MEKFIANLFVFGAFVALGIVSTIAAFYLPPLGFLTCITLLAYFLDYNKRVFGKFIPKLNNVLNNKELVSLDHKFLLGMVIVALLTNLIATLIRSADTLVY